jgi:diguanylate cyclase (GGDEF)-like protein
VGEDAVGWRGLAKLVKLAWLDPETIEIAAERSAEATELSLARQGERTALTKAELLGDLLALLGAAAARLGAWPSLARSAAELSYEVTRRRTFAEATDAVLAAPTLEAAESAVAKGLAKGLELDRAALFVRDTSRGAFVGGRTVGGDDAFAQRVRGLALAAGADPEDEPAMALRDDPVVFERSAGPSCPALVKLWPSPRFVLGRIACRGSVFALAFGDRADPEPATSADDVATLRRFLAVAAEVWHGFRLRREVEDLTRYDALTGLLNRRELEARFAQERSRAQRNSQNLAFVLVTADGADDGVKQRDALLRSLGVILRGELRALDVAARFDEDRVAMALPGAGSLEVALVARRVGVTAYQKGISLSMGAASYPDDCDHPDDLVGLAEKNLAAAIAKGRGRAALSVDGEPIVFGEED